MVQEKVGPVDGPAIEIKGLSRRYGSKVALDDVNLTVSRGCVFGLLGESGAGKTTLMRHLMGLLRPQRGTVRVMGHDPIKDPETTLSRIGYLSEDRDLPGWMRVDELLRYTQGIYPNWDDAFADDLMERFDLDPAQKVKTLSRGQKAKTGLVTALAHRPDLLMLDEPSSGLDPVVRRTILSAVMRAVAEEGRTVLFSSHLLHEVESVADYVCVIHRGKVVLCDELSRILGGHRRIRVRYAQPQSSTPVFEGALNCEGHGREWTVLCDGMVDKVRAQIVSSGAEIVDEAEPSLEDVFVARIKT